ncbi:DUF2935 domain-containing protein [Clostridium sp. UBA6640]|uniref:DUF2935 domain-containing protein n=1 Tax=Clostridium sp. UBA6640 TaxID=1946370 RepID=UPI0025C5F2D8|nr:DUF2935 domain-containing protein [Clostridium sp. UBA6640]
MLSREAMFSREEFIEMSLELNLFFLRIQKEHSTFLEAGFTPKNPDRIEEAAYFRRSFDQLLLEAIRLSKNVIPSEVMRSGEFFTEFTLDAELSTESLTGIPINTNLTRLQLGMIPGPEYEIPGALENRVTFLNKRAIYLTNRLIDFKRRLLEDVVNCRIFTFNYQLLIDHILREAELFVTLLTRLQNNQFLHLMDEAAEQEVFWDRIMAEHSLFIRGLLDPTEEKLIGVSNNFAKEFERLLAEAQNAMKACDTLLNLTKETMTSTENIRDFKRDATKGLLGCTIHGLILPLLGDHVLREANHFLRLLEKYNKTLKC